MIHRCAQHDGMGLPERMGFVEAPDRLLAQIRSQPPWPAPHRWSRDLREPCEEGRRFLTENVRVLLFASADPFVTFVPLCDLFNLLCSASIL